MQPGHDGDPFLHLVHGTVSSWYDALLSTLADSPLPLTLEGKCNS